MTTDIPKRSWFVIFLVVACLGLVILNVVLVTRMRALQQDVMTWKQLAESNARSALLEGETITELPLRDASGGEVLLSFGEGQGPTIIFVSSTSCDFCAQMAPIWQEVALRAEDSAFRVIGIVLDGTAESLASSDSRYPTFMPHLESMSLFARLPAIPATIIISDRGEIDHVLFNATADEMMSAINENG